MPAHITGYSTAEHSAIERYLTARTVPLTYVHGDRAFVQGTGTFFRLRGKTYLVTAAHILEHIDPALLGVPDRPNGNVTVWRLSDITIHHPRDTDKLDVAVIELLNPNFHTRVASSWHCIDEAEVIEPGPENQDFVIAGYPAEAVEFKDGILLPQPMLQLFTKRFTDATDADVADYDLLLKYPKVGRDIRGNEHATPKLGGVSGAVVYARVAAPSQVWSPDQILRPVGIQASMKHGEFIRVKRWTLLWKLFEIIQSSQ